MVARQYLLGFSLIATLAASYWASTLEDPATTLSQPVQHSKKHASLYAVHAAAKPHNNYHDDQLSLRAADVAPPVDLFAPFYVTVNDTSQTTANHVPTMPNNPYSYAGKISEDGTWTVFLTDGSNNFAAKVGDALQNGWLVKQIGTDVVVLLYQPLKQEITLQTGAQL